MIILAAAIILSLNSSNIVGKAKEAQTKSDAANIKHAASLAYAEYALAVNDGKISPDVKSADSYVKEVLGNQGISENQLKLLYVTQAGKINVYKNPVIPAGFVKSQVSTEDDVLEGIVIYKGDDAVTSANVNDAKKERDQYVWVPVADINDF